MKAFLSHIHDEAPLAFEIHSALGADFRGLDVFLSANIESILVGDNWFDAIEDALRDCSLFLVLCSPTSIRRPWIHFEAGAAWIRGVRIIPLCHGGLTVSDLPLPLSLRQGVELNLKGVEGLYYTVSAVLNRPVPASDFAALARRFETSAPNGSGMPSAREQLDRERKIRVRLLEALESPRFRWRTLDKLAHIAAISEQEVADVLRSDDSIRFSRSKKKRTIVGLRSRVGN